MKLHNFGKNLKEALKQNKMSQAKLAKKLGTTQQTVSRWISEENQPDFDTLILICLILDESPNSLFGFDEFSTKVDEIGRNINNNSGNINSFNNNNGTINFKK